MSALYSAPLWDLSPKYVRSEETDEFRWMEYRSISDPLNDTNIRIRIDDGNSFLLASEALLAVDFTVSATATLVETDEVAIPNGWGLFDDAKLFLNDKLVQATNLPEVVHHMTASHQYSKDYAESVAESQMFYPMSKADTPSTGGSTTKQPIPALANGTLIAIPAASYPSITGNGDYWLPINDPFAPTQILLTVSAFGATFTATLKAGATGVPQYRPNPQYDPVRARSVKRILDNAGVCSVFLPLREIWPILSQAMGRVNRGSKVEVQLTKCGDYARTFYTSTSPAGLKFVINRCSVWIPRLAPSLEAEAHIEAQIASGKELREPFEKFELYQKTGQTAGDLTEQRVRITTQNSRVLRLYVGAQLDTQMTSLAKNPLQFDAQNFDYVEARVNGMKYPLETYQVNNTSGGKQGLIRMLRDIHQTAGKTYDYENGSIITYDGFVNGAQRIYVLDLTQMDQSPFKKQGISDLEIRYKLSSATSGTYTVNVVVCSEGEMVSSLLNGKMLMTQV